MYLSKLQIKNFRSIKDLCIEFKKGLNVIIGENNSGKTSIIDALRISFGYGDVYRDAFITQHDFHIEKISIIDSVPDIEFDLFFTADNETEYAFFNDLHTVDENGNQDLQLHFRFSYDEFAPTRKIKYRIWGGANEGHTVAVEQLQEISHVFLGALRDAENSLKPIRGNKVGQLYVNLKTDIDNTKDKENKNKLANKIRTAMHDDPEWKALVDQGKTKINEHLGYTTITGKEQDIDISFLPFEFNKIVDSLKIQMPIYPTTLLGGDNSKQRYFELHQNGLGYNNLIYIATVLGDLKQKREQEAHLYASLLIEEPEAHLHPQLQNLFFDYLNTLNKELGFQIFITSHSPTITAKANLDCIVVLQNQDNQIKGLALSNSGLSSVNKKYLHKYLDVTRSQFLFSNGVIFVEGISEALLLPIFADMLGTEYNLSKNGIEIVNTGGVAFEHFGNLFNNDDSNRNLSFRSAIITDDDRDKESEIISSRAKNAEKLSKHNQKTYLIEQTLEYALFIEDKNRQHLLGVFEKMHPKAHANLLDYFIDGDDRGNALKFVEKVEGNKAKAELSHQLSILLSDNQEIRSEFVVPAPIKDAIKYVIKGE